MLHWQVQHRSKAGSPGTLPLLQHYLVFLEPLAQLNPGQNFQGRQAGEKKKKKSLFKLALAWSLCCQWLAGGRSACLILFLPCSLFDCTFLVRKARYWFQSNHSLHCWIHFCCPQGSVLFHYFPLHAYGNRWLFETLLLEWKRRVKWPTNFCFTRWNVRGKNLTNVLLQSWLLEPSGMLRCVCSDFPSFELISHIRMSPLVTETFLSQALGDA